MAIIIKSTESKKIIISGTDIEVPQVYGRIRFLGDYNGNTIQGEVMTFANSSTFAEGKIMYTDVPIGNYQSELETNEEQSLNTAHKYAKQAYEEMGYEVVIDLL